MNRDSQLEDQDAGKGAVEQDRPEQRTNVAPLDAQLDHRYQDPLNKQSDSDLPEPGQNPEHSGEPQGRNELNQDTNADMPNKTNVEPGSNRQDPDGNAEGILNDQDPGERQKENQNQKEDDDLAA